MYAAYVGCAIPMTITVKFGTAHGRSRPEVGSTERTDAYAMVEKGLPHSPVMLVHLIKKTTPPMFL